jgi:hypothetical protein
MQSKAESNHLSHYLQHQGADSIDASLLVISSDVLVKTQDKFASPVVMENDSIQSIHLHM